jgi:Yqey-like protein
MMLGRLTTAATTTMIGSRLSIPCHRLIRPSLIMYFSTAPMVRFFFLLKVNDSVSIFFVLSAKQPIVDIVAQEMKAAMKAKEASKLSTIRMIRTGFQNAAIELKIDTLSDEQVRKNNNKVTARAGHSLCALTTKI